LIQIVKIVGKDAKFVKMKIYAKNAIRDIKLIQFQVFVKIVNKIVLNVTNNNAKLVKKDMNKIKISINAFKQFFRKDNSVKKFNK